MPDQPLEPIPYAEAHINSALEELEAKGPSREKAIVVTKLEEALLWLRAMERGGARDA